MKSAVVFFSKAGENMGDNYEMVDLIVGNTKRVAEKIHDLNGADLFEVLPKDPYPFSYTDCVARADEEAASSARPELMSYDFDPTGYEIIYLGFPLWCATMPMVMFSLIEKIGSGKFKGKIIKPFVTHEGSGFAMAIDDLKEILPDAKIEDGLEIFGHDVELCDNELKEWV